MLDSSVVQFPNIIVRPYSMRGQALVNDIGAESHRWQKPVRKSSAIVGFLDLLSTLFSSSMYVIEWNNGSIFLIVN